MKTSLAITGVGMLSPIGLNALACMNEVRSAASNLTLQRIPDRARAWIVGGAVPTWTSTQRGRRLQTLAERALRSAWRQACLPASLDAVPTAMILGAPEAMRPGYRFPADGFDAGAWAAQLGVRTNYVEVMAVGACSAHGALHRAAQLLSEGRAAACAIVVADSQLQIRITRWHEDNFRLKCSYLNDGLMPAEAACCLVVENEQAALSRGARILARIAAVAAARESATILSAEPNAASGLTAVVRAALRDAGVDRRAIGMVWSDLNGEGYRAREWALTEIRLAFETHTVLMHPADCHGDLGAATDANLIGLAALCHGTNWSERKPLLVISGSDQGLRAACVIEAAREQPSIPSVSSGLPRIYATDYQVRSGFDAVQPAAQSEDPPRTLFEWQVRVGHKEDLSALCYQRQSVLVDASIPWRRLREPEQRMLNHADAIVAGGALSVAEAVSGLTSDEEGLCFGAALVVGGFPGAANLDLVERALAGASDARLKGIEQGLRHVPEHETLFQRIDSWMRHADPRIGALALRLAADRRRASGSQVLAALRHPAGALKAAGAAAAWRLGLTESVPELRAMLEHEDPGLRAEALRALMVLMPDATAQYCRMLAGSGADHVLDSLATLGNTADAELIAERTQEAGRTAGACRALGVLGDPRTVPVLLRTLQSSDLEHRLAAAQALELISGLRPRERASIEEPVEPGAGEPEVRTREIERVATSYEPWAKWWDGLRADIDPRTRLRRGKAFSPGLCVDELDDPRAALAARQRAYFELLVFARVAIPFEPDWFVARQEKAIGRWRQWRDGKSA